MAAKKPHPLAEIDLRILERRLRKGEVKPEEVAEMLATLPETGDYAEIDESKLGLAHIKEHPAK
jgi:hypothetical protein